MPKRSKWVLAPLSIICLQFAAAAAAPAPEALPAAEPDDIRQEFVAAMQRVRLNLPDTPDPPALAAYAIHDYLVAARYRRDLIEKPDDAQDAEFAAFLLPRAGLPVTHGLRRDWLQSLARRRRWDLFLPRSAEVTDAVLVCDRLEGRLATGDTEGLGTAALARWSLPQRQPTECNDVFAWLPQRYLITPALAASNAPAALAADNPRLAREAAADVPVAQSAALLQWSDL